MRIPFHSITSLEHKYQTLFFFFFLANLEGFTVQFITRHWKVERQREREQSMMGKGKKRAVYYVSHGAPTLPLQEIPSNAFLRQWQSKVHPVPPKAILVVSAHWDTPNPTVNTVSRNSTIHDFYGFPPALYQMQYNAIGAPNLAKKVKKLLMGAGFKSVDEDPIRGLDHGAWVPLCLMYPKADIPVCQLSIQSHRDALHHYRLGQALAPLREEDILIVASGSATHNLHDMKFDNSPPPSWALAFDKWLHEALVNGRFQDVIDYERKAPRAKKSHPSPEHFYPLLVALGAAGENCKSQRIHSSWMAGSLSMASFSFT